MINKELKKLTYISLFSSAGVGCFGFEKAGFNCIATNELIERRLQVQKWNNKCKYNSGYICGDITQKETENRLLDQIEFWKKNENISDVDVLIATPPCQGMSVANLKKKSSDLKRNSLVVASIKLIKIILPRFFIFENVPAFMKTICTDVDMINKPIEEAIKQNLSDNYVFSYQVLNFKNYGSNSSRTRTLVIGIRKDIEESATGLNFFPDFRKEKSLHETIGYLPSLKTMGEIDSNDFYHAFRIYDSKMRPWIHELKEGQSAFDNIDPLKRPHQIIDGKIVQNVKKNADKYTRQFWNKVGPCIHTRNDQLASQNTIHPTDDRVFSIRELMIMMSIPEDFKWCEYSLNELNKMNITQKRKIYKENEVNIRQSIGEAVPTQIFYEIALKIKNFTNLIDLNDLEIKKNISENNLSNKDSLVCFVRINAKKYTFRTISKIVELANAERNEQEAFYTDDFLIEQIIPCLPSFDNKTEIRILEPSVGSGNFIPLIFDKYKTKNIIIDVVDIDETALECLKITIKPFLKENIKIHYINDDFLLHKFSSNYDIVIGNPPFQKLTKKGHLLRQYLLENYEKNIYSKNTASFFLEKSLTLASFVGLIMPKNLLNTPEYKESRAIIEKHNIKCILDFGEKGFKGVLVETLFIGIFANLKTCNNKVLVSSLTKGINLFQNQDYITDCKLPYWIIFRNKQFDEMFNIMHFNIFVSYRDRQITSSMVHKERKPGDIRVLKSRDISDDGKEIKSIVGYDDFITTEEAKKCEVFKFFKRKDVFLVPNLTYKMRIIKKESNFIMNGSVAVLELKEGETFTSDDCALISTDKFRNFLQIARNYQTRSLNIDVNSVFFLGKAVK
ncbi:MAG: DNA cytosine methyltransferase [Bacilli bacterium]